MKLLTINYNYDTRGNRTQSTGITVAEADFIPATMGYNVWDELDTFTNTATGDIYTYEYDAEGLRIKKTAPGGSYIRYHYDGYARVVAESDGSGTVAAQNIWGHKALARKIGADYFYYLYNGHGDVVQILNESGSIVNRYSYDEWGNIRSKTEGISNPIRYAGEYYDDESGLYYLRARYYDPTIGRFISRDSYEGDISNPLSLNSYSYCYNNPLVYLDPSGHEAVGLRASVEASGGSISWDDKTRTATATINGITRTYSPDDESGLRIENGRIIIDSDRLANDFNNDSPSTDGGWNGVVNDAKKIIQTVDTYTKLTIAAVVISVAMFYASDYIYKLKGDNTAYRYVGESEMKEIRKTGQIPNTNSAGDLKDVFVSPNKYNTVSSAENGLRIGSKNPYGPTGSPKYRVEFSMDTVKYRYGGNVEGGTGIELITEQPIPIDITRIYRMR